VSDKKVLESEADLPLVIHAMRMDYRVYDVSLSFVIPWDIDLVIVNFVSVLFFTM